MKYEREFLQQKGIPHLPGDWDFRSEAQQVNWISENNPKPANFILTFFNIY